MNIGLSPSEGLSEVELENLVISSRLSEVLDERDDLLDKVEELQTELDAIKQKIVEKFLEDK